MDSTTNDLIRSVERAKEEVETAIGLKEATDVNLEYLLASYRSASESLVFRDYARATSLETEMDLWKCHTKVNNRFRRTLKTFRGDEGKKRVVERRKSQKHYLTFIKSSQSFYRGFLQRLASHFANIDEVLEVARKINSNVLSIDKPVIVDAAQKQLVLVSCHSTLVHLGDLSRYRETEIQDGNRNWGPAKGYYRLAITVLPTSGSPYNQLAVIAQTDQDVLGATYYLYRAFMIKTPQEGAQTNLENEFVRICTRWTKPESFRAKDGIFMQFPARFVFFHAKCYAGKDFEEHRDLETELVHEITATLLQKPDLGLLNKICLINIAAEAVAFERLRNKKVDNSLAMNSYYLLQSFNVKIFSQLLHVLVAELRKVKNFVDSSEIGDNDTLTPIVRCLLPMLRQYSSWLLVNIPFLVVLTNDAQARGSKVPVFQAALVGQIQELWTIYVDALAALAKSFNLKGGRALRYLLAEDEDSISFKPFADPLVLARYQNEAGDLKARSTDPNVTKEEPAEEMLHRVRQFVKDGMAIARATDQDRKVPVRLRAGRFVCEMPNSSLQTTETSGWLPPPMALTESVENSQPLPQALGKPTTSTSMDTVMRDMVDDLIEETHSNQIEHERPASRHGGTVSPGKETFTAADLVKKIQRSSQNPLSQSQSQPRLASGQIIGSSHFSSGLQDSAIRPGPAHASYPRLLETPTKSPRSSGGHSFTDQITRQQQDIQARSSPQQSLPQLSSWTNYETPTGLHSWFAGNAQAATHDRSPSLLSLTTPLEVEDEEIKKPLPRKNLFGAIGETPGRTPTSAQPG